MPVKWMPTLSNKAVATPSMLLYGSIATLVTLWLPLFKTGNFRAERSYSLWDLREVGAPGLPLLVLGAVLLVAAGAILHLTYNRSIPSMWLSCLAIAETLGILVALSIGFALALPDTSDLTFLPGLPLLIAGLTATLVATSQLPDYVSHQRKTSGG